MELHDIFLVFVEGSEGNRDAYCEWFAGPHKSDMTHLPGVLSAYAYRLTSLDGHGVPAQLCAIYATLDGPGILTTIAAVKGTDALPVSDLQGPMTWRILEGRESRNFGGAGSPASELICMFGGPFDEAAEDRVCQWLCANTQGIAAFRQTRLGSAQPRRGSEYGSVLFIQMAPAGDPSQIADAVAQVRTAPDSRFLLASPAS